jgi:hypothetical protein
MRSLKILIWKNKWRKFERKSETHLLNSRTISSKSIFTLNYFQITTITNCNFKLCQKVIFVIENVTKDENFHSFSIHTDVHFMNDWKEEKKNSLTKIWKFFSFSVTKSFSFFSFLGKINEENSRECILMKIVNLFLKLERINKIQN